MTISKVLHVIKTWDPVGVKGYIDLFFKSVLEGLLSHAKERNRRGRELGKNKNSGKEQRHRRAMEEREKDVNSEDVKERQVCPRAPVSVENML